VRHAGQVIAGLLSAGLAAAVMYVLLAVVAALADCPSPHFHSNP